MKFRLSTNTALLTADTRGARAFYGDVLGLPIETNEYGDMVKGDGFQIFLDSSGAELGLVLELVVNDVEEARTYLEGHGCKVLQWGGVGQACLIEDPQGLRFNIWQDP